MSTTTINPIRVTEERRYTRNRRGNTADFVEVPPEPQIAHSTSVLQPKLRTEATRFDKKMYELLLSSAVASSICFFSVIFAVLEFVCVFHIELPLFWVVIATASLLVNSSH